MCERSVSGIASRRIAPAHARRGSDARRAGGAGGPSWVGSAADASSSVPACGPDVGVGAGPVVAAAPRRRPRTRRPKANSGLNGSPSALEAMTRMSFAPTAWSSSIGRPAFARASIVTRWPREITSRAIR